MTTHYQLKTHEFTTDIFIKQFEIEILHYQGKLFTNLRLCYLSFIQLSNFELKFIGKDRFICKTWLIVVLSNVLLQ